MPAITTGLQGLSLNGKSSKDLVCVEDYDIIPKPSSKQKLSPLDMNMPRLYGSRWILCFPLSSGTDKAKVYGQLREALAHTIASIPWIAGEIGQEEDSDPANNRIQVVEGASGVEFRCQDLSSVLPSYTKLKDDHFTFSKLTSALVSPLQVIQASQPVFAAQANFIKDGLLLTVGIHHSVSDATGLDFILDDWAVNTTVITNSTSFTTYDPISNDRMPLSHRLPAEIEDFPEYIIYPTPPSDPTSMGPPTAFQLPFMTSKIFYFSPTKLAALKAEAKAYSTNDALCALFWHHITRARNPNLPSTDDEKTSNLCFSINIRSKTSPPLPPTYLGNASIGAITPRLPVTLLSSPANLPLLATSIRSAVKKSSLPNRIPLTIGLLTSRADPQDFKFNCNAFLGDDLTATSWADIGVLGREWGGLGRPEGFRIPYEAADGTFAVFPRGEGGGLEVMCALESKAMERMVGDERFGEFVEVWG